MLGRLTRLDGTPEQVEDGIRLVQERLIPRAREIAGLKGGFWLVDRKTGRAAALTLWESEQALRATEEQANQAREQAAGGAGMTIREVEAYEVVAEFGTP